MTTAECPDLTFDVLTVGQRFDDMTMQVTPAMVRDYSRAVHNDALLQLADAPPGTPLDDPSMLILFGVTRRVIGRAGNVPAGGILAMQDFESKRPLRLGDIIRTRTSIAAKYEKRGRRYVQVRCELEDSGGEPVGQVDSHIIWAR